MSRFAAGSTVDLLTDHRFLPSESKESYASGLSLRSQEHLTTTSNTQFNVQ